MVHTPLFFFYHSDHLCYHSFLHMGFNLHPLYFQVGLEALPSLSPHVCGVFMHACASHGNGFHFCLLRAVSILLSSYIKMFPLVYTLFFDF